VKIVDSNTLSSAKNTSEPVAEGIVCINLPLPYTSPAECNVYLLHGRPPVLIDTGLGVSASIKILRDALIRENVRPDEIKHIFLTHAHSDHAGAAAHWAREYGTTIWVNPREASRLNGSHAEFITHRLPSVFNRLGVDEEMVRKAAQNFGPQAKAYHRQKIDRFEELFNGLQLPVEGHAVTVICTPGHSPGSVSFFESNSNTLFTGDTLLTERTPRPTLTTDGPDSLYYNAMIELALSIEILGDLPESTVFPGHGPFAPLEDLIDSARESLARKKKSVYRKLSVEITPFDLIRKRTELTRGAYLAMDLYQTRAILQALVADGLINMEVREEKEYFQRTQTGN